MGLLDRIRSQPAWKHADPTVRAAAVQELGAESQEVFVALAREDGDPRVRRAAVRRLNDATVLIEVASADSDPSVRDEAAGLLVTLALHGDDTVAGPALAGIADTRQIALVARSAQSEAVARAALARISDVKALGQIARHAEHASARVDALARLDDPAEIAAVALKSVHRDVALAAVDRIEDPQTLESVALRAQHKAAARRAKARLRELKPWREPAAVRSRTDRRKQTEICERLERLSAADEASLAAQLEAAQQAWIDLVPDVDEDLAERFAAATAAVRARLAALRTERAERHQREQEIARQLAAREALCDLVDSIGGEEDAPDRLAAARREWERLMASPPLEFRDLTRRFERACQACEGRHETWKAGLERRARLAELCEQAEQVVVAVEGPRGATAGDEEQQRWELVRQAWIALAGDTAGVDRSLSDRFAQAEARMQARLAARREEQARRQRDNFSRLQRFCADLDRLLGSGTLTLRQADRTARQIRSALDDPGPLPSRRDHDAIVHRLRAIQSALIPKLQELREIDEWERWANATVQEELCARTEALAEITDPAAAARALRAIQERWKQVSAAPHQKAQALWFRFKAATDRVRATTDAYFAEQAAARAEHLRRKMALCEQAEALAESSDWIRTADAIKRMQAEWKTIGPAARGQERVVWERFRAACDRFFTRRHEDLARRKEAWAGNLARKQALCARVEALAESTDWEAAAAEIRNIQAEWRTIGPVRKNRSEAIWQRFRAACDRFFERYKHRDQLDQAAKLSDCEQWCREIESWVPSSGREEPPPLEQLVERLRSIRTRWQQTQAMLPRPQAAALSERFDKAAAAVIDAYPAAFARSEFDVEANSRRLAELCERVERLVSAEGGADAASPAARLAAMWREALAANTIGGKVDEEAKWRAAADEVREAQAAWQRVGYVPAGLRRSLSDRFHRASRRFFDERGKATGQAARRQPAIDVGGRPGTR